MAFLPSEIFEADFFNLNVICNMVFCKDFSEKIFVVFHS